MSVREASGTDPRTTLPQDVWFGGPRPLPGHGAPPEQRLAIGKVARTAGGYLFQVTSPTQQLAPALDIDARLTEIERSLNLLLNVTPVNAAEA